MERLRILFLAADPDAMGRVSTGREAREIRERLRTAAHRDAIELVERFAVRPGDLQRTLFEVRPHVVHFSGHGTTGEDLVLEGDDGGAEPLGKRALTELFRVHKDTIRVVVLSACHSRPQVEAISEHVECAIGMRRAVGSRAATEFSAAFYLAVGFGASVATAFESAVAELRARGIPEAHTPLLVVQPGTDAARVILLGGATAEAPEAQDGSPSDQLLRGVARADDAPPRAADVAGMRLGRLRAVAATALAFGVLAVSAGAWRAWRSSKTRFHPIEPFEPSLPGIVLGGPWLLDGENRKLCDEIEAHGPVTTAAMRCVPFPAAVDADELEESARKAGARLVAVIGETGVARVRPLGRLENDPLLGGLLVMNVGRRAHRALAPFLWKSLAYLGTPEPTFALDLPCPEVGSDTLDKVALLTLLVVPACEDVKLDARQLTGMCGTHTPDDDETCALGRFLRAEAEPDVARSLLTQLRDRGPERFRSVAKLKLARLDCKDGRVDDASRAVLDLAGGGAPCMQAKLAEVAACIGARGGGPDRGAIAELEGFDIGAVDRRECGEAILAEALAGRAHARGQAGRWVEAAIDFRRAYELLPEPIFHLALAESLLHPPPGETRGARDERVGEVRRILDARPRKAGDRSLLFYGALLDWIASRRDGELLRLHAEVPAGEPAMTGEADDDLRSLACAGAGGPCVYDVLRRPSSQEELARSLKAR
jgi:hypothetical protein